MKKFFVIGNPIEHSLSPILHNYWIKKYNLHKTIYEKKKLREDDLKKLIDNVRSDSISGINVTVPFKKSIIPFLDKLSIEAKKLQSVNTIFKLKGEIWGENTDWVGFGESLRHNNYDLSDKDVFIIGAGGVTPAIIYELIHAARKIYITNRTQKKAEELKKIFPKIEIIEWGNKPLTFDIAINATSLGLKKEDIISIDFTDCKNKKTKLFYDVIYNPKYTNFLKEAKKRGNKYMNGKLMFVYQARLAFKIWHNILPKVDDKIIKLLD